MWDFYSWHYVVYLTLLKMALDDDYMCIYYNIIYIGLTVFTCEHDYIHGAGAL